VRVDFSALTPLVPGLYGHATTPCSRLRLRGLGPSARGSDALQQIASFRPTAEPGPERVGVVLADDETHSLALFGINQAQVVSFHPAHCTTHGTCEISISKTLGLYGAEAVGNAATSDTAQACARRSLPPGPPKHHIWCSVGPVLYRPTTPCAWTFGENRQDSLPNPHGPEPPVRGIPEHPGRWIPRANRVSRAAAAFARDQRSATCALQSVLVTKPVRHTIIYHIN